MSEKLTGTKRRIIASNGYILLRMPRHHLADSRGYVYEHRFVAEQILGRPLQNNEIVHHKDNVKTNNNPDNLEIVKSIAHHKVKHRKNCSKRMPGESNPLIICKCGCGRQLSKYDSLGRKRNYIIGHNQRGKGKISKSDIAKIKQLIQRNLTQKEIAIKFNVDRSTISLIKLNRLGSTK